MVVVPPPPPRPFLLQWPWPAANTRHRTGLHTPCRPDRRLERSCTPSPQPSPRSYQQCACLVWEGGVCTGAGCLSPAVCYLLGRPAADAICESRCHPYEPCVRTLLVAGYVQMQQMMAQAQANNPLMAQLWMANLQMQQLQRMQWLPPGPLASPQWPPIAPLPGAPVLPPFGQAPPVAPLMPGGVPLLPPGGVPLPAGPSCVGWLSRTPPMSPEAGAWYRAGT